MPNIVPVSGAALPALQMLDASTSTGPSVRHELERAVSNFGLQVVCTATSMVVGLYGMVATSSDATPTLLLTWSCAGSGATVWTTGPRPVTAVELLQEVAATSAAGLGATAWLTGA